jgi:hypothetical protein
MTRQQIANGLLLGAAVCIALTTLEHLGVLTVCQSITLLVTLLLGVGLAWGWQNWRNTPRP